MVTKRKSVKKTKSNVQAPSASELGAPPAPQVLAKAQPKPVTLPESTSSAVSTPQHQPSASEITQPLARQSAKIPTPAPVAPRPALDAAAKKKADRAKAKAQEKAQAKAPAATIDQAGDGQEGVLEPAQVSPSKASSSILPTHETNSHPSEEKDAPSAQVGAVRPSAKGRRAKPATAQAETANSPREDSSQDEAATRKEASHSRRWPWIAALILVALVVLVGAVFSWDRWYRYNDAADFQGQWYAGDSAKTIVIDESFINLTSDVAYTYTIDSSAKTITLAFGNLSNTGRYRFSPDRTQLVITEGSAYSLFSTLFDDIAWQWNNFVNAVQGLPPAQPQAGEGITIFERERAVAPPAEEAAPAPPADEGVPADPVDSEEPATPEPQEENATDSAAEQPTDQGANEGGTSTSPLFDLGDIRDS